MALPTDADVGEILSGARALLIQPVEVAGRKVDVALSVGVTVDGQLATAALAAAQAEAEGVFWRSASIDRDQLERSVTLMGELDAAIAAGQIEVGAGEAFICAGLESMSRVPMGSDMGAWPTDPSSAFPTYFVPQGVSADMIATKYGFSRDDVDAYSVESHKRAAKSWAEKRFAKSVLAVKDQLGLTILDHDETIRPNTDMQTLGGLNPSFTMMGELAFDAVINQRYPEVERVKHVHTPGNSSGIVDGAAGVLIGSLEAGQAMGLKPRARIKGGASIGSEPSIMLTGPEYVSNKLLNKLGMSKGDIDLWELNEAFAAVVLRYMQAMDIPHEKMNVCGGAIAM
ncbi:hypothetical protein LTR94_027850, partial [Friedmanniomyces endolithicus]